MLLLQYEEHSRGSLPKLWRVQKGYLQELHLSMREMRQDIVPAGQDIRLRDGVCLLLSLLISFYITLITWIHQYN
jgi:hypothetical protein